MFRAQLFIVLSVYFVKDHRETQNRLAILATALDRKCFLVQEDRTE